MMRLLGRLLVVALIATAATTVIADPSSAVRRNPCLDQQHYLEQQATLQSSADASYAAYLAFDNTQPTLDNSSSVDVWVVPLPGLDPRTYWSQHDFDVARQGAWMDFLEDDTALTLFELDQALCTL